MFPVRRSRLAAFECVLAALGFGIVDVLSGDHDRAGIDPVRHRLAGQSVHQLVHTLVDHLERLLGNYGVDEPVPELLDQRRVSIETDQSDLGTSILLTQRGSSTVAPRAGRDETPARSGCAAMVAAMI